MKGVPMKKRFLLPFLLAAISLTFFNCGGASQPKLSPMQVRELTTKLFESDYETIFRSTLTILQDQGYVIKNTDMAAGLILGYADRKTALGSQLFSALMLGFVAHKGTDIEVSCMLNKINDTSSELRMNIQEAKYGQSSTLSGNTKTDSNLIRDPKIYNEEIGLRPDFRLTAV
jgi:hypothetical protein